MQNYEHANDNLTEQIVYPIGDYALPFMLNNIGINGRLIHLSNSISEILAKHNYPNSISMLLGELLMVVSLLGSNLKSKAIITAEVKTNKGLIKLLIADYNFGGDIRGYCLYDKEAILNENIKFDDLINEGCLIITLDMGENFERYQGIVEIKRESLTESLVQYLISSQQINAAVKISVVSVEDDFINDRKSWMANGMLIQQLPQKDSETNTGIEEWEKLAFYIGTIKDEEMLLLNTSPTELLKRLFHEEEVWVFDPIQLQHKCRCSREKMQNVIDIIPPDEKEEILKENDSIEVICEFCNYKEIFI